MKNPLKEYPHLFANGKFKAHMDNHKTNNVIIDIRSVDVSNEADIRINHHANVYELTLVARPISDMTDEECNRVIQIERYDVDAERFRELASEFPHKHISIETFLYLLSIGVYPFDQSHFDDGTVITK